MSNTLAQHLDQSIDIQRCQLLFNPVGVVPLATCRLALPESHEPTPVSNVPMRPVNRLFNELIAANVPFIYQVLVKKTGANDYLASVRLCAVDNALAVDSREGFRRLYQNGYPYDVSQIFGPANMATNFDIPVSDYYRFISHSLRLMHIADNRRKDTAREARHAYTGAKEFENLMQGDLGYTDPYDRHVGFPKFPVAIDELSHFLTLVDNEYETSPWAGVPGRAAPRIDVTDTAQDHASTTASGSFRSGVPASQGSAGHDRDLEDAIDHFATKGYTFIKVDQDSSSLPDAIGIDPDGELHWLEYDNEHGKPENYLKNAARAVQEGVNLHMVVGKTDNSDDNRTPKGIAEAIAEKMYTPYRETDPDRGTRLYTRSQDISLDDNEVVVLPKGANETCWYVTQDDDWQLVCYADGARIAAGPADESVTTFDYDSPRYIKVDVNTHVIEAADGTELARASTEEEVLEGWTKATIPHLPVRLSYGGVLTLWYEGWSTIHKADTAPNWATTDGKMERYESATKEFLANFTVSDSTSELPSDLAHRYLKFVLGRMTDRKLPNHKKFGRVRNKAKYPTKRAGSGGRKGKVLKNRRWVLPPEIVSPDVPSLDPDSYGVARAELEATVDGSVTTSNPIRTQPEGVMTTADESADSDATTAGEADADQPDSTSAAPADTADESEHTTDESDDNASASADTSTTEDTTRLNEFVDDADGLSSDTEDDAETTDE